MKKTIYNALNDVLIILLTILFTLSLITNQVLFTVMSLFLIIVKAYKKGDIDES